MFMFLPISRIIFSIKKKKILLQNIFKAESPFCLRDYCQDIIYHTTPDDSVLLPTPVEKKY